MRLDASALEELLLLALLRLEDLSEAVGSLELAEHGTAALVSTSAAVTAH